MTSRRTGVLGGTFDPVHRGHVDVALAAADALHLDQVLLIPSGVPPHRPRKPATSTYHRFAMVAIAALTDARLRASEMELVAPAPSYTATTIQTLVDDGFDPSQLFFITGADAFAEIATWRDYPGILDRCTFVSVSRPGAPVRQLRSRLPDLADRMRDVGERNAPTESGKDRADYRPILLIDAPTAHISATEIRQRVADGAAIDDLVPSGVGTYIARHGLYTVHKADELHGED